LPTTLGMVRSVTEEDGISVLGWTGVVRQSDTNTCGPAVIATLLEMRGAKVNDEEVTGRANLGPEGVTLAEFARLAGVYGLPGHWFRSSEHDLNELTLPAVVHLSNSSGHFALLLRLVGDHVQLADPARGMLLVPLPTFRNEWSGRIFLFRSPAGLSSPVTGP
jgi:ABC-type bacteriocin/lantibiotic exporter with double-glycine peptidase domain